MNCATNISQIEKIYADSYNHDVKAPVVYADGQRFLFADADHTIPVDCHMLNDLFNAGVLIITHDGYAVRPLFIHNGNEIPSIGAIPAFGNGIATFAGYSVEHGEFFPQG